MESDGRVKHMGLICPLLSACIVRILYGSDKALIQVGNMAKIPKDG